MSDACASEPGATPLPEPGRGAVADAVASVDEQAPAPWALRRDLAFTSTVVLGLAAIGAALGWPWQQWAPRTIALVYNGSGIVPDETEAFIAGDGRFVILTAAVGFLAGALAWLRRDRRGPGTALALAIGGAAGSYLTAVVGRLVGGGTVHGRIGTLIIPPVELHARQLLAVEPLVALLVYVLCALFTAQDSLGRPGPQLGDEVRASD